MTKKGARLVASRANRENTICHGISAANNRDHIPNRLPPIFKAEKYINNNDKQQNITDGNLPAKTEGPMSLIDMAHNQAYNGGLLSFVPYPRKIKGYFWPHLSAPVSAIEYPSYMLESSSWTTG